MTWPAVRGCIWQLALAAAHRRITAFALGPPISPHPTPLAAAIISLLTSTASLQRFTVICAISSYFVITNAMLVRRYLPGRTHALHQASGDGWGFGVRPCCAMPCRAALCHAMLHHASLRFARLRLVVPCCPMPCHAMQRHAMLPHALPCCVILCWLNLMLPPVRPTSHRSFMTVEAGPTIQGGSGCLTWLTARLSEPGRRALFLLHLALLNALAIAAATVFQTVTFQPARASPADTASPPFRSWLAVVVLLACWAGATLSLQLWVPLEYEPTWHILRPLMPWVPSTCLLLVLLSLSSLPGGGCGVRGAFG